MQVAEYPRYDRYRDSEADWAGSLPTEWATEKAKWLFLRAERPVQPDDEIVTCFRDGQVTLRSNRRTEGFTNALKEHGYQRIHKGDLVIHAMDAFAGAIGVSDSTGKSTPVYSACIPRKPETVNPYFYAYYMRSLAGSGYLVSLAKGIRERSTDFRFADFAELVLALPSLDTQNAIVRFLDEKTGKIDAAIALEEQQIALLKERKQIVIQNAVTKGLNPNAPMKDSGVDWIGEIPAHWAMVPLKRLFSEKTERTETGEEVLLSLRMHEGLVPHDEVSDKPISSAELKGYKKVRRGQMVMNRMRASIGLFGLASSSGLVSPDYAIFDVADVVHPPFFLRLFKTPLLGQRFRDASRGLGTGAAGFMRLYTDEFGAISVAMPPLPEQQEIVKTVDREAGKIEDAIRLKEQQIANFKEYKASLINSAVTGKIKVA